jgi:aryl-alcohol dehydrogenase-like predicted oxidoreductase/GrpB-like predicted nucleotidyltransferase (UPF0157 family)
MEAAILGKTGLKVSRLGGGLAEIGASADASTVGRLLNAALDGGINFLDTAACYGDSEEWIGRTISHRRREYILATKAGHITGGYEGEAWTARTILDSVERSLKRMKTDHLDLVQLHSCGVDILERGEVIQALLEARRSGKTRYIGYSGDHEAALWAIESGQFDTLQTTFNLVDQGARMAVFPRARAKGMGIIAKRPIANAAWGAPASSDSVREWYRQRAGAILDMGPLPAAPHDPIFLALGFVLAHEEVDTAIVGTRNPDHMRANVEAVESSLPLPAEVIQELQRRFDQLDMARRIEIVPYNPAWPRFFEEEAARLVAIFGPEIVAIHHIGSTAIPAVKAKPIVDMLVEVRDVEKIDAFNATMSRLGYLPRGEFGIAGRRYFIKGDEIHRTHHIHMYQTGHPDIARHLDFRDYLIAHPGDAQAYSRLKEDLARRYPTDAASYVAGKDGLVKELDRKAKAWREATEGRIHE